MTTEEKLLHFQEYAMTSARNKSNALLDDYRSALEGIFQEHCQDVRRRADLQVEVEKERLRRKKNKLLSQEILNARSQLDRAKIQVRDRIIGEVIQGLETFKTTAAYPALLEKKIRSIEKYAGEQDCILYVDPSDTALIPQLQLVTRLPLQKAETAFIGGIQGFIPSRNVMVDLSFSAKLEQSKENYQLGGAHHA